ncbi:CU044_5270 family protein [Streptomyces sp. NBC_00203]|uniref:CU044_5270 family protein n=1 Tax=Streptomyces sp. NBC_00203 TaxID=2975680 RepID=UPI0032515ED6
MNEHEVLDFPGVDALIAAGEVAPPDAAVVDAALAAVRLAAVADSADARLDAGRPRRRFGRTRRSRILLSAAVAAVVAGAVAVPTIPFGGTRPAASADAASFLHEVASTAADARTSDAPYWKVRRKMITGENSAATGWGSPVKVVGARSGAATSTVWFSRSGMISRAWNGQYAMTPAGKEPNAQMSWQVAGRQVTWDDLRKLPTEPRALKAYLYSGTPDTPEQEAVFNGIVTLLTAPVSPELRSALYDVLAGLPYLRLVGSVHDSAGRAGVAIEYDLDDVRSRVVIDPETALPLEEKTTALGGTHNGDLISAVTYLSLRSVRDAPKATSWDNIPPDSDDPLRKLVSKGKK